VRIVILGSGRGSNCQALLEAHENSNLGKADIIAVISDVRNSGILKVANMFGVSSFCFGPYKTNHINDLTMLVREESYWISSIRNLKPDLIVLAGFMKILSNTFINSFDSKIINLHPSLLPSFRGANAIQQAWDAGVKITGCTIHWVNAKVDSGKIIAQEAVHITKDDTLEILTRRIHDTEHKLLTSVVAELSYSF
jgi:phosphoribosylglycinamide formyltransferase-1